MKTTTKIATLTLIASSLLLAKGDYEVKSAKIEFEIKSTQNMGNRIKEVTGTKRIVIDNYGEQELEEISRVMKYTRDGKTKVDKSHHIKYINGNVFYTVDLNRKTMNRMTGYMGTLFGTKTLDYRLKKLQKMKKIGTDTVAGHKCDVWQLGKTTKTCYYKGILLREESTLMSMKKVVVATKVEFDIKIKKDDFKIPIFPINGKLFTHSELEEMDKKSKEKLKKDIKETERIMKIINEAYAKAGVEKGKEPTKEQKKIAKKYMQDALFPTEKKKFLKKREMLKKIKPCYEKAQTLDEANKCEHEDNDLEQWNDSEKKEILKEIEEDIKIFDCVEKSKNGEEMEICFPEDY